MSDTVTLQVETRDTSKLKAKDVRRGGQIPAIFYGKGKDPISLQMDYQTFRRMFKAAGESTLIELDIDGGKNKETVLVHDYQLHPVTDEFTHVDFIGVDMKKEITTQVHLEFVGVSPAVKDMGGILSTPMNSVEVKCLPKDMPHHIEVNIEALADFSSAIHVSDLPVPTGVEITTDAALTVATVSEPRSEEELAAVDEAIAPDAGVPEDADAESAEGEEGAEGEAASE